LNDFDLVAGVSRREPEAFHEVMERYAGPVINLAYRFLGNRADAEEIAQETFLRLYQRPPRLDPSAKLFTWVYRVTANLCLDRLRKQARTPPLDSVDVPEGPEPSSASRGPRETAAGTETAEAVRRAVTALPVELRAPLILSALEELPHAEIARILGLSPKAVERRISRARALLKQRLQPYL
jgi:RNA polymerase sigma-70 factor (ECF subfamily)